jgi:FlaA1/EpsC-like NDP-sugar epimerase
MLDMGEPVNILQLACDLIHLSGLDVGRDIDITFTGLRPGEKLFEEMFTARELYTRTEHEKVLIAPNASHFVPSKLDDTVAALVASAHCSDDGAVLCQLRNLVPEYHSPSGQPAAERIAPASTAAEETPVLAGRLLRMEPAHGD